MNQHVIILSLQGFIYVLEKNDKNNKRFALKNLAEYSLLASSEKKNLWGLFSNKSPLTYFTCIYQ